MHETLLQDLADICRAVEIESPTAFSLAGHRTEVPPGTAVRPAPVPAGAPYPAPPASPLVGGLQMKLYLQCYARRFDGRLSEEPATSEPDPAFVAELAAANCGRERVETGWRAASVDPSGRVLATRGNSTRSFTPGEYAPAVPGEPLQPGAALQVFLAKGSLQVQPGYYVVFGESLAHPTDGHLGALRLYFNVRAGGAARLVAAVTRHLNRFQVPFTFKTLTNPGYYESRADGSVLFTHRRVFPVVSWLLPGLEAELGDDLLDATPLFTKRIARGVGLAEDPGTGDSFGLSRCRILAEALWDAHGNGVRSVEGRLDEVDRAFRRQGLSLERPYLNPRSADRYHRPDLEEGP